MNEKILITGGAGFIGSHIAEEAQQKGYHPVIFDNLTTGRQENLTGIPHTFIYGDIRNWSTLSKAMKDCSVVFHLAALTSVVESMKKPEDYIEVNVKGTLNVLRAASESNVKKIIFSSSAAIYGDSQALPKTEVMKPDPKSPYAITKLDGEHYCLFYRETFGLKTVCSRFFNVFGERQDPASPYAAAIPIFVSQALANGPMLVYGDGNQTRDFIYVKDVVKALIFLMENADGIFNIGCGQSVQINELAALIKKSLKSNSEIIYSPERPGEIRHSRSSIEKLLGLNFRMSYPLEDGLNKTVRWYRDQYNVSPKPIA